MSAMSGKTKKPRDEHGPSARGEYAKRAVVRPPKDTYRDKKPIFRFYGYESVLDMSNQLC